MEQKELKEVLSNFGPNSGTQLKYYIITSLYPSADKSVIKDIGDFNVYTYSRIASVVRELALPPLVCPNPEVAPEKVSEAESAELAALKEENERLKDAIKRKELIIKIEEQTLNSNISKIDSLKEFIQKVVKNRESVIQCYRQAIGQLRDQGIEVTAVSFSTYKKEMEELLK